MEENSSDQAPPVDLSSSIRKKVVDRVTLGAEESERADAWINQLREASKGFLDLTKSDLVNLLVRSHARVLTAKEVKAIRAANYDPIRHLNWITPRLKDALAKGDMDQVTRLQSEIRSIELSVISTATDSSRSPDPPRTKSKRTKKPDATDAVEHL